MVAQVTDLSAQPAPRVEIVPAPATVFGVIDETVSAVLDRLNRLDEQDTSDGVDEAHFQEYVRWRVALVNDAVLLVRALLAEEDLAQSVWGQTHGRA